VSRTTDQPTSITRHAHAARKLPLWIALVVCLMAAPAYASHISQVRVGNHPTFTRLVFELDTPTGYRVERRATAEGGEQLVVTVDASSRTRSIESKSAGIESVHIEGHASKAVAQIHLRKSGLQMKEMILSNPARIVLDFELPAVVAATSTQTAAPKPEPVAVNPKPLPKPEPVAVNPKPLPKPEPVAVNPKPLPKPEPVAVNPKPLPKPEPVAVNPKPLPKPAPPVIAAIDSVPTADDSSKSASDEHDRAEQRAKELREKLPGVHKRDEMLAKRAAAPEPVEPSDSIANAAPGVKPAPSRAPRSDTRELVEKLNSEKKKKPRGAGEMAAAPKPKESPVNMAVIAAAVAAILIVAVLVVRRSRKRSMGSALDVAALAEEAELDAEPAAAVTSADERTSTPQKIPVKGFSMDGDSRALEPSLRETEPKAAAYSMSEVAVNEPEPGPYNEDTEGEEKMDLDTSDMSVEFESGEFNVAAPVATAGSSVDSRLVQELATRLATLEARLDEASEARERLERQVAAQSEELRVQRAAIARTQRALRSLSRSEAEQATEPALRDPAKQADSSA
jgi:hypothetical protein